MRQIILFPGEDNFWVAECPSLPGCVSQGQTREEAIQNIREAIQGYIASLEEDGLVCSAWDTSNAGPARRVYARTDLGAEYLQTWVIDIRQTRQGLDDFLAAYESFISNERKNDDEGTVAGFKSTTLSTRDRDESRPQRY